jgi:hypothetical protein
LAGQAHRVVIQAKKLADLRASVNRILQTFGNTGDAASLVDASVLG